MTLSDPRDPARIFTRLSIRQTALSASGVRKGDHIRDPRTGEPVRRRLAAWVALPRPGKPAGGAADAGPRLAPGAVADALTTAFMLLPLDEIEGLCARSPGLERGCCRTGPPAPETCFTSPARVRARRAANPNERAGILAATHYTGERLMADENDKGKTKTPAAGGPPKLDRRDLLMGLSTVPALGCRPRLEPAAGASPAGKRRRPRRRRQDLPDDQPRVLAPAAGPGA